jgi:hypothetical protein
MSNRKSTLTLADQNKLMIIKDMLNISRMGIEEIELEVMDRIRYAKQYRTIRLGMGRHVKSSTMAIELIEPTTIVIAAGDPNIATVMGMYVDRIARTHDAYRNIPDDEVDTVITRDMDHPDQHKMPAPIASTAQFISAEQISRESYSPELRFHGYARVIVINTVLVFQRMEDRVFYRWVQPLLSRSDFEIIFID